MDAIERVLANLGHCIDTLDERDIAAAFAPSFLEQLPTSRLRELLTKIRTEQGPCTGWEVLDGDQLGTYRVRLRFAKSFSMDGAVCFDDERPPRITSLLLQLPSVDEDTWDRVLGELDALPGAHALMVRDLTHSRTLGALHADHVLPVGSVSKLLILAPLLASISDGSRAWSDLVSLQESDLSLPSGILQDWPVGARLTINTVVALLLSHSDNTAADLLLRILGRSRVEAYATEHKIGRPEGIQPFLSTRGLFNLLGAGEERCARYAAAATEERRRILEGIEKLTADRRVLTGKPWPEGLDWYLTAADSIRLLDLIRLELERSSMAKALYGMSRGGVCSPDWKFAGFKGGSSPGRIAMTALLQDKAQRWFGACLLCQSSPVDLKAEQIAMIMRRTTDLALRQP